jgi:predicted AAA+ superfamily ATPase
VELTNFNSSRIEALLERIAESLERLTPVPAALPDFGGAEAFLWDQNGGHLVAIPRVARVDLDLLQGIDRVRDILLANTRMFAKGFPANNALLWGSRGMGKSSLVKAIHASVAEEAARAGSRLLLIEIHRDDIPTLPRLLGLLRGQPHRFLLFCDDLSFDHDDAAYKSLKAVLDGGIEGRPPNVLLYATSNRRHLMPREMIDNERSTAVNPGEAVEEKISLSDRFGLWLGFHPCDQATYFAMVRGYADRHGLDLDDEELTRQAKEWSVTRGGRSGRVAWQFIQDLAGRMQRRLD